MDSGPIKLETNAPGDLLENSHRPTPRDPRHPPSPSPEFDLIKIQHLLDCFLARSVFNFRFRASFMGSDEFCQKFYVVSVPPRAVASL